MVADGTVQIPADVAEGSIDVIGQTIGGGEGPKCDQRAQQSVLHKVLATFVAQKCEHGRG